MNNYKGILPKGFLIDEKYSVLLFIKQGSNAETYRVKGKNGKLYFLKLFNHSKLSRTAFDNENNLLEIKFLKKVNHENIVSYIGSGELIYENKKFVYLVLDFIAGETLAERINREQFKNFYDIKLVIIDVLKGLNYLHSLSEPIIHNEITPQNIMLDLSDNIPKAKIIDFGYARSFHQSTKAYNKDGLNLNYVASECFNGLYSPQSDIFSIGAVMYQLIYGILPWFKNISRFVINRTNLEDTILQERLKPLSFSKIPNDFIGYDENIKLILKKALSPDIENRFQTANEFIRALNNEIKIEDIDKVQIIKSDNKPEKKIQSKKVTGKGFDAIAGMKDLKEQLQLSVIDAIKNPEQYKRYGIPLPNGLLLYGPPRCGKTFFAKKFAEEVGFNYIYIKPSNLQSKYINATQENIAKMFEEAEKNAPTIIFIDELDALVPNREGDLHQMHANAVNEMLAQMDRTGEKGIFIIGASNRPEKIDPAILGAGRLEKKFFIGTPDFEARKEMFKIYLKNRPLDFGINYELLAELTENFVSGDMELIVNDSALIALKEGTKITMEILEKVISSSRPSVSIHEIEKYNKLKLKMESDNIPDSSTQRNPIGFKTNNK